MSHFTKIATEIRQIESLREALTGLGCKLRTGEVRGWQGRKTTADCVALLPTGGEVGFVKQGDGTYALVADWQSIGSTQVNVERVIRREYAAAVAVASLRRQGVGNIERAIVDGKIVIKGTPQGKNLTVSVDASGDASVAPSGYVGQACRQATAGLEKAIGAVVSRKDTPEAFKVALVSTSRVGV